MFNSNLNIFTPYEIMTFLHISMLLFHCNECQFTKCHIVTSTTKMAICIKMADMHKNVSTWHLRYPTGTVFMKVRFIWEKMVTFFFNISIFFNISVFMCACVFYRRNEWVGEGEARGSVPWSELHNLLDP